MDIELGPPDDRRIVKIELPPTDGRILFCLSGGADSAILLYALAKMMRDNGAKNEITLLTIPRPDNGAAYVNDIVAWINGQLGTSLPTPLIAGDGNAPHEIVVRKAIRDLWGTGQFSYLYVGDNEIPPTDMPGLAPVRVKNVAAHVFIPFMHVNKSHTIDLYFHEHVEDLLTLSHSCTERTDGRCGECFQCNERKWAFERLGQTDPGSK